MGAGGSGRMTSANRTRQREWMVVDGGGWWWMAGGRWGEEVTDNRRAAQAQTGPG